jgi:hypothetical protein
MSNNEIKNIIQLYFDGELEKERESLLFTILAESEEGRNYFKMLNMLHTAVEDTKEEFPSELEERILRSIEKKEAPRFYSFKRNIYLTAASFSIAAVMLIASLFLFFELKDYKSKVNMVSEQLEMQNQTIELILNNSLPPAEVRTRRVNEIIIKANI